MIKGQNYDKKMNFSIMRTQLIWSKGVFGKIKILHFGDICLISTSVR